MDPANRRPLKTALGLALEFVWHKTVIIQAKPKRVWSQLRPLLQDAIKRGIARSRAVVADVGPEGVEAMTRCLEKDALTANATTPGEKSVSLWLTEASADMVRKWLGSNGSRTPSEHSAFCSSMNKLMGRLCKCRRDVHTCPVHAEASVTLADLVWWSADAIYENVPTAVPSLSLAMTLKFSSAQSYAVAVAEALSGAVPSFCHFLCNRVDLKTGEGSSEQAWVPNNAAIEVLISMRPVYLLQMILMALTNLTRSSQPCRFADMSTGKTVKVCRVLLQQFDGEARPPPDDALASNLQQSSKQLSTLLALETVMTTMVADESEWAAAWGKLLWKCMQVADLDDQALAAQVEAMKLKDLGLDVPPKFRHLLSDMSASGGHRIKAEAASPRPRPAAGRLCPDGTAANATPVADGPSFPPEAENPMIRLSDLYTFHPDPLMEHWNVVDMLSLQSQVSAHLYAKAFHPWQCMPML